MGKNLELALCLLLTAACSLEGQITRRRNFISWKMTWTDAKLYCQTYYTDLFSWDMINVKIMTSYMKSFNFSRIWIGLLRDPKNDSVWKSINLRTGEGVSGDDLSQTSKWASGQNHCAVVGDDLMWYSAPCSNKTKVYCSQGDVIQYYDVTLSWNEAVLYCKEQKSELATVTQLNSAHIDKGGWIGLYRVGGEIWNWTDSLASRYRKWAPGQPLTADCGSFDAFVQEWVGYPCSQRFNTLCFGDNLVVVKENKTWEDALMHCRAMKASCAGCKYDLLSLTQVSEYSYVRDRIYRATTDEVWIGLRFLGSEWIWLNGNKPNQQDGLPDCPPHWTHCGTMSKYDTNSRWIIRNCAETRNFVCILINP